jgi:hypothetical protein
MKLGILLIVLTLFLQNLTNPLKVIFGTNHKKYPLGTVTEQRQPVMVKDWQLTSQCFRNFGPSTTVSMSNVIIINCATAYITAEECIVQSEELLTNNLYKLQLNSSQGIMKQINPGQIMKDERLGKEKEWTTENPEKISSALLEFPH